MHLCICPGSLGIRKQELTHLAALLLLGKMPSLMIFTVFVKEASPKDNIDIKVPSVHNVKAHCVPSILFYYELEEQ